MIWHVALPRMWWAWQLNGPVVDGMAKFVARHSIGARNEVLRLEGVSLSYGSTKVLSNVSLSVEKGDFLGIIGPNGSGKTTLLKVVLGLVKGHSGSVLMLGKRQDEFSEWHRIGYVPQKATNIDEHFPATAYEVVSMGLLSHRGRMGLSADEKRSRVMSALASVDMGEYSERIIGNLSGGQQQRVLIAKALVSRPDLLFLDEPTTGVDEKTQKEFYEMLSALNRKGLTIILVSHDIGRITRYVNKVASLNQSLKFYGTHREFCARARRHKESHQHEICIG